jgi:hypothetical protein
MMRLRAASVAVAFCLLAGCASTLPELRQAPPQRTATVLADRPALISCVISGLRAAEPGTILVRAGGLNYQTEESARRSEITGYGPSASGGQSPYFILTLTTASPNVAIESRWNSRPYHLESIDRQAWPIIERRAGSKVEPTPSLDNLGP